MAESCAEVLLDVIPNEEIRGIYLTGSAAKRWDSPIDYLPEIGDVDVHIQFLRADAWHDYLGTVDQALDIQSRVEKRFFAKVTQPVHIPRPQLNSINKMMSDLPDFVHAPRNSVRVLYGEDYPPGDYSNPDQIRRGECKRVVEDASYLVRFPLDVIDKPGKYLWQGLRYLVWRVSPTGPRVLHMSGAATEEAWSLNRTGIVSMLSEVG